MKTSLVFTLVLILCHLSRAQVYNSDDNDVLLQAPNVESGEEKAETWRPRIEDDGDEQEPESLSDIWAELRDLRDMVVEQKVQLRHLTTRVTAAESTVDVLQENNAAMEARLTAAESSAEELQNENNAQTTELAVAQQKLTRLQQRLTDIDHHVLELEIQQEVQKAAVQELQNTKDAMEARMTAAESLVEELQMENDSQATELAVAQQKFSTLQQRLTDSDHHVLELEKQQEGQTAAVQELQNTNKLRKLAFSASLLASGEGNTYNNHAPLIFRNVLTNIGNHYNPNTGTFTAPVSGVFYFGFFGQIKDKDSSMIMSLVKNKQCIFTSGDTNTSFTDPEDNVSNGGVLQLEVGDVVSVQHFGKVWDDQYHRTTFSGFLLFPL